MHDFDRKPSRPNIVLSGITVTFAILNIGLMLMYANSLLGPVPFELIWLFLGISVVGAIAMLPVYVACRHSGLTWPTALSSAMIFCGLALFNYWCLYAASAAV